MLPQAHGLLLLLLQISHLTPLRFSVNSTDSLVLQLTTRELLESPDGPNTPSDGSKDNGLKLLLFSHMQLLMLLAGYSC